MKKLYVVTCRHHDRGLLENTFPADYQTCQTHAANLRHSPAYWYDIHIAPAADYFPTPSEAEAERNASFAACHPAD